MPVLCLNEYVYIIRLFDGLVVILVFWFWDAKGQTFSEDLRDDAPNVWPKRPTFLNTVKNVYTALDQLLYFAIV